MASSSKAPTISTVDDLIALIASCDTFDLVARELLPALQRADKNGVGKGKSLGDMLIEPTADGKDPLDVLQPPQHGAGYLYILAYRMCAKGVDPNEIVARARQYAHSCRHEELGLVPGLVCHFAQTVITAAEQMNALGAALEVVTILFQKFTPMIGAHCLTPLHRIFAYLCLRLDVSEHFCNLTRNAYIYDINYTCPITYNDNLLYHYYAGILLALQGEYEQAVESLETVVSAPGSATAAVQLEAYKKLVLVNYLFNGKSVKLPKYTSQAVQNHFKSTHGEAYSAIVEALQGTDLAKTTAVYEKHVEAFRTDNNVGLVEECMEQQRPQVVQKLTETYVALSLSEIAAHLLIPDPDSPAAQQATEQLIINMISARSIHADIKREGGEATVSFLSDPEPYNTVEAARNIDYLMQRARFVGDLTLRHGRRIGSNKDFLQKALNSAGQAPGGPGGYASVTAMDDEMLGFGAARDEGGYAFDDSL